MRVTLKQLQAFDAVARFNSISKAADEIALSVSALSIALKELESKLSVQLFERRNRTLTLNENGRRLQPRVRTILTLVHELEGKASTTTLKGKLRIATGPTIGEYVLPTICSRFLADHPDVLLKIVTCSSAEAVDRIESMKQDIGFIEGTPHWPQLKSISWIEDELLIFCGPEHPLAGKTVTPEQLEPEIWCMEPMGSFTRYMVVSGISKFIDHITIGMEINNGDAIKRIVRKGLGIGCLSRISLQAELERGELCQISVPKMPLTRRFQMILKNDVYHGEIMDTFIEYCQGVTADSILTANR